MKYALGNLLFAGVLVLSFGAARADVLTLTSSALKDNDQLTVKNACADKQRSPNCVGENISPPLAWSDAPEGTDFRMGQAAFRNPQKTLLGKRRFRRGFLYGP